MEENEPVYIEFTDALEFYAAIIGGTIEQAATSSVIMPVSRARWGGRETTLTTKRPISRCRPRRLRTASPRARHSSTETSAWRLFQC